MSRNMQRLLSFLIRYPEGWHSIARDSVRAMNALEARGLIEVVRYAKGALPQARLALPEHTRVKTIEWSTYHERAVQLGYRDTGDALRALADFQR